MPDNDHRADAAAAPAASPTADHDDVAPHAAATDRDRSGERLAGRVAGVAITAVALGADAVAATARGVAHGARDGATAVGEGIDGAAGILAVPGAAARAEHLAQARREWARDFAERNHGDLLGEVAAGATSAVVRASPAIAAGPLGPEAVAIAGAITPAGIAATDAREHGASPLRADLRGIEAGLTAGAAHGVVALHPLGALGDASLGDLAARVATERAALGRAAALAHDPTPALHAAGDAAADAARAGARDAAQRWARAQAAGGDAPAHRTGDAR